MVAPDPHSERILILDFGAQYTQLIARAVREAGVYCEIHAFSIGADAIRRYAPKGIILSGGPETVTATNTTRPDPEIYRLGVPVLGICYGMQTMAADLGGEVESAREREFGYAQVRLVDEALLFNQTCDHLSATGAHLLDVWMSHGDRVIGLPPGFKVVATTDSSPIAAMADESRRFYGIQFHPEVSHTRSGKLILQRFAHDVCGCGSNWTPGNIIEDQIASVRRDVGGDGVILGLSGGVDSSVVAALLQRAIGGQLTCIFVDNGLLRLQESEQVMSSFKHHVGVKLVKVDAADRFLSALAGVADPEEKRKVIGRVFIEVFEREAGNVTGAKWLAQGTIYPDVIESARDKAGVGQVIKSHHNVGGLPDVVNLRLLEPLRELFKDEVRKIGIELGLPHKMVYRHPFPGPGLAVRVLGEVRKGYLDVLRQADAIYIEELERHQLYDQVSQAFAVFLPVRSVGVVGDNRAYEHVIALRAVETVDFMTADWAQLPHDVLATVSSRIINEVRGVSRVTYDISSKPPATIEWE
ncbi:MAG: glutamine-hydrolyzing GMP synthase [Gammaproteobacteria bacterium]|nr:glutamine-hydrolyzing GMP synthase [Gammaproteobacteria bacterium]